MAAAEFKQLRDHLASQILGQDEVIEGLLTALLCEGHVLIEGAPDLAKTLAFKALAGAVNGRFARIQFTPDLLPANLTGSEVFHPQDASFVFQPSPQFNYLIVADEINRAPAKVKSALLEAMAEHQITVGKKSWRLPPLFMVATSHNPIEQEGTYPLPEAQLDRFLLKLIFDYPNPAIEIAILQLNASGEHLGAAPLTLGQTTLQGARSEVLAVSMQSWLEHYLVELVCASRPGSGLSLPQLLKIRYWAKAKMPLRADRNSTERGKLGRTPGLTFRELRAYQAGDEISHIDWRVTARLGRPYTRLYREEQDQHSLLLDLSPAMYFSSTMQLKARLGCELAAALIWRHEKQHNTLICHGIAPHRQSQRGNILPLLESLCHHYRQVLTRQPLSQTLTDTLGQTALPHGARLTVITDYRPCESALCQQLQQISLRHDIHYWQICDPLEAVLPPSGLLPVTINRASAPYQGWLDGHHGGFSHRYQQAAKQQMQLGRQHLLPLAQLLYLLDKGQTLQQQWQEGLCHQG